MYSFLDIETTGLNPEKDKIIEIAIIKTDANFKTIKKYESLIKIKERLPQITQTITGITDKDLQNAPSLNEIKDKITKFIEKDIIIGHNISFDLSFLKENQINTSNKQIDTLFLSTCIFNNQESYSLEALAKKFKINNKNAHRAISDVKTNIKLAKLIKTAFSEIKTEKIKQILSLSEKTDFDYTVFFESIINTNKTINSENKKLIKKKHKKRKNQSIYKKFNYPKSILIESNQDEKTLLENLIKNNKTIIADSRLIKTSEKNKYKILREEKFVSKNTIKDIINKNNLSENEIKLFIKIILNQDSSGNTYTENLNLLGQEKNLITLFEEKSKKKKDLSIKEKSLISSEFFIKHNLKINEAYILNTEKTFLSLLKRKNKIIKLENLILLIEQTKLNTELKEKTIILTGLIGVMHKKYKNKNNILEITADLIKTKEYQSIKLCINNLEIISKNLKDTALWKKQLLKIKKTILKPDFKKYIYQIHSRETLTPAIEKIRINPQKIIQRKLALIKKKILISKSIDLNDNGRFFKEKFGIENSIQFEKNQQTSKSKIILNPVREKDLSKILKEEISKNEKSLILINSKVLTKNLSISLKKKYETLLSETFASIGKINILNEEEHNPIIIKPQNLEKLKNLNSYQKVFISKLRNDKIDNYLIKSNKDKIKNKLLKLKNILSTLSQYENIKEIQILDQDLLKSYNKKEISKILQNLFTSLSS